MRRRSNSSLVLVLFIALVVIAILAYRTKQSAFRGSPSHSGHSTQGESAPARVGPRDIYPDPDLTPGATNPDITQDNIQETICNPSWSTKSIRPPAHYTNELKIEQIQEYSDSDTNPREHEEDHLIPLELGGNPTDPKNLWPEPYETSIPDGGARSKDRVENYLHRQVCSDSVTLDEAQREISSDWYRVYIAIRPLAGDRPTTHLEY